MTDTEIGGEAPGDRFDRIEAILRAYPNISESDLAILKHWFRKEASAFEAASLASKDSCRAAYIQFRADHIDRFDAKDWIILIVLIGGVICTAIFIGLFVT